MLNWGAAKRSGQVHFHGLIIYDSKDEVKKNAVIEHCYLSLCCLRSDRLTTERHSLYSHNDAALFKGKGNWFLHF